MKDLFVFPGGTHTENWLFAENCPQVLKAMPCQVAGEYDRGDFTLGVPFVPSLTRRQSDAMKEITSSADYPMIIWLEVIPQEHCTWTKMALRIEPDISGACSSDTSCCKADSKGLTFDVVEQEFDNKTLEPIGAPEVIGAWTGLNADAYSFTVEDYERCVPTGVSRLIGIRLLTPLDAGAEKLPCLVSRITPIVKVHNFDAPLQTM